MLHPTMLDDVGPTMALFEQAFTLANKMGIVLMWLLCGEIKSIYSCCVCEVHIKTLEPFYLACR